MVAWTVTGPLHFRTVQATWKDGALSGDEFALWLLRGKARLADRHGLEVATGQRYGFPVPDGDYLADAWASWALAVSIFPQRPASTFSRMPAIPAAPRGVIV